MTSLTAAASTVAAAPTTGGSDLFKGFSSISNRVGRILINGHQLTFHSSPTDCVKVV